MFKVAVIVWIVMGSLLAGSAVTLVLSVGSLSNHAMTLIAPAALIGFVLAVPLSLLLAKRITTKLSPTV